MISREYLFMLRILPLCWKKIRFAQPVAFFRRFEQRDLGEQFFQGADVAVDRQKREPDAAIIEVAALVDVSLEPERPRCFVNQRLALAEAGEGDLPVDSARDEQNAY